MFAKFYNEQMADVDYEKIYNFLKPYIKKEDFILDAGCGPGYLLKYFINDNYNAIGVDNDISMLNVATNTNELFGHVFYHDLRDPLKQKFDVIISVFDVINYFKGVKGVFTNIYNSLNEEGVFIFDIYNKEELENLKGYFEFGDNYEWETYMEKNKIKHEIIVNENRLFEITQYGYNLNYYVNTLNEVGFETKVIKGPDIRKHYIVAKKI